MDSSQEETVGEGKTEMETYVQHSIRHCMDISVCDDGGDIMKMNKSVKKSFVVIGKEGSTLDGDDFIQKLWNDANTHFEEVQHLAKKYECF